jgi:hypothetical protein
MNQSYNSLDQILDQIDDTRAQLLARVNSLTDAERNYRPAPDAWSACQILEHLATIERNMLRLINKLLSKAEAAGVPAAADGSIAPISMDEFIRATDGTRLEAPEAVRPTGTVSCADSLASLVETRAEIHVLRARLVAIDLAGATFPHPYVGPLNLYQWLAFIGLHERRHLAQLERTVATGS